MAKDTWAEAESALSRHLREHPELERSLLDSPPDSLNGADLFLRASVLEERSGFEAARDAFALGDERTYSPEVRAARDAALARVVEVARDGDGTLVDVATGRGTLLEQLVAGTTRPLVATDVSPTVLERVRRRLGDTRVEYVVADALALPFDDRAVPTLVSHVGLANVAEGARLLRELRRVGRELVATHVFYPESDEENRRAAREHGLDALLFRDSALPAFAAAGWEVTVEREQEVTTKPTPASDLIEGFRIDALPAAPTRITYCALVAR